MEKIILWISLILSAGMAVVVFDNLQHSLELKLTAEQVFNVTIFGLLFVAGAATCGTMLALKSR